MWPYCCHRLYTWSWHFRLYISPFKCVFKFPGYSYIYIYIYIYIYKHKTGFSFLKCNQLVDMLVQHKRIFVMKLKDAVHFQWTRRHSINVMDWTINHVCQSNDFLSFLSLNIPFNHTAHSWKKKKNLVVIMSSANFIFCSHHPLMNTLFFNLIS